MADYSVHHPEFVLATPVGSPVLVSEQVIQFPSFRHLVQVPYAAARTPVGSEGCLWNPNMGRRLKLKCDNARDFIEIAEGYQVRISCGVALYLNSSRAPVLIRNSDTHPTRPGEWNCPRGLLESASFISDIIWHAVKELCEELVPLYGDRNIGRWVFEDAILTSPWQDRFCEERGCSAGDRLFSLKRKSVSGVRAITFGSLTNRDGTIMALPGWEPDTGSLEIFIPFEAMLPLDVALRDGELDTLSDKLLNRPVFDPRMLPDNLAASWIC